jgi:hypothetical protein
LKAGARTGRLRSDESRSALELLAQFVAKSEARRDGDERDQDQEKSVFGEILANLFLPQFEQ